MNNYKKIAARIIFSALWIAIFIFICGTTIREIITTKPYFIIGIYAIFGALFVVYCWHTIINNAYKKVINRFEEKKERKYEDECFVVNPEFVSFEKLQIFDQDGAEVKYMQMTEDEMKINNDGYKMVASYWVKEKSAKEQPEREG